MRGLRSTIALGVVLVGLCAYIYFVTSKIPDAGTEPAQERVFAALEADKIDEITVKADSGETTTLKKDAGAWNLIAPLAAVADETEVSAITSNLSTLELARIVDENASDLAEYGLDSPRIEVEFKASGDSAYAGPHKLAIGAESPTGGYLFARRDDDKRVLLIPGFVDSTFNRSTFDLRSKTLLSVERDKVDRLVVSSDGKTVEIVKDGTGWKLTSPLAAAADPLSVDALLNRAQSAAMKSVVAEQSTPADLGKYGFDRPQGMLTLHSGNAATSLVIGAKAGDDVYVREPSKPLVATADASLLTDLQKPADEYRRKEIFAFQRYTTDRLELIRDGVAVVFERTRGQDQNPDKWRRVTPTPAEPDATSMDNLFASLEGLRVTSFVEPAATSDAATPALIVDAKFENGTKDERVSFVRPPAGAAVWATVPGQPGPVTVAAAEFDEVLKALDAVAK
jgi:hypothetical protein